MATSVELSLFQNKLLFYNLLVIYTIFTKFYNFSVFFILNRLPNIRVAIFFQYPFGPYLNRQYLLDLYPILQNGSLSEKSTFSCLT